MYRSIVINIMAKSTSTKTEAKSKGEGKVKEPKLRIDKAQIIFANLEDSGFGTSLTIKVTPEIEDKVTKFWEVNQIGNEKTVIGEPNFKMYEQTKQLSLKVNDATKFAGVNGLNTDNLGFGATVNFILNAFEYNNKFTKGQTYVGASLSAVVILSGRKTGADADLNELMGDLPEQVEQAEQKYISGKELLAGDEPVNDLPF